MANAMGEERCKHGLIATMCGESGCLAAPKNLPGHVWRTRGGETFHRRRECQALIDGQRQSQRRGREVHEPELVPLSQAMSDGITECFHCFPPNVPPDAKPCQVLIDGKWTDAFLISWKRGPDNRWKGEVDYRHNDERRSIRVDQDKLRSV